MASDTTNRVYLPDGQKIYVSDDQYGDQRINELREKYGNLYMEACTKVWGQDLDSAEAFWTGTLDGFQDAPEFVEQVPGVCIVVMGEHDPTGSALSFHYSYGDAWRCELSSQGDCSEDGMLWQADDMGAPEFCTNHYFPQEQLGYEFIAESDVK